jgi:predicted metal-dependent HD superfamily phosphohydrolase
MRPGMASQQTVDTVRKDWQQSLGPVCRYSPAILAVFEEVERRYAEPTRHYHTLDHVQQVTQVTYQLSRSERRLLTPAIDLAAILHDVVYDSRAKDNEERSAEYAHEVLASLGVDRATRDEVARLILLTKRHETTVDDFSGQFLLDADLSVLGADEGEYDRYADAIRREYSWVSDEDYRTGRWEVLKRFLARPRLYFTPTMHERCEAKARANLAREIASLGG